MFLRRRAHPPGVLLAATLPVLAAVALAGCHRAASTAAPAPASPAPTLPRCPAGSGGFAWPAGAPASLPQPPGARLTASTTRAPRGFVLVTFTSPQRLAAAARFVLAAYPAAGFALHGGGGSNDGATVRFAGPAGTGVLHLAGVGSCTTAWTLLVAPARVTPADGG